MKWLVLPVVAVTLVCAACDNATGPQRERETANAPPGIASYAPPDSALETFVGETVRFSMQVTDPDGDELSFAYFLGDSLVSTKAQWDYAVADLGPCRVWGVVSDATHEVWMSWRLTRYVAEGDPIEIVAFTPGATPDESIVRWIAGRDTRGNPLRDYWVRTALEPITTEYVWTNLTRGYPGVGGAPTPGDTMTMSIYDLTPLQTHFVAVRGVDSRDHFTHLGPSPSLAIPGVSLTGTVTALPAGTPAAGVNVRLSGYQTVTGADGRFALQGLPSLTASVIASDDDGEPGLGAFYDYSVLHTTSWVDTVDLYLLLDQPVGASAYYPNFLVMYRELTIVGGIPTPNSTRRWNPPIKLHVPPFAYKGLDYGATIVEAAEAINASTGLTLFTIVDEVPDVGVTVVYSADATADRYGVRAWTPDWYPARGEITFRVRYQAADLIEFRRVARHELGHALGLDHSRAPMHLMYPQFPTRDDFHPDELAVIRTLYAMPRGLDVTRFIND